MQKLLDYGWSDFFEKHFKSRRKENLIAARVMKEDKIRYHCVCEKRWIGAELAGRLRQKKFEHLQPVVGDWVVVQVVDGGKALIVEVLPRKSKLSRRIATGRKRTTTGKMEEQLLGANIDTIFIVSGLDNEFNLRKMERYLTAVYAGGANPVIVLNKSDLCENPAEPMNAVCSISNGEPVHVVSAKTGDGISELHTYCRGGETVLLAGASGVGKSTIINRLLGEERQVVREKSTSANKGRHTTTHREIIPFPKGGLLMDIPGMREFQLWATVDDLQHAFRDIFELAENCRFGDCRHNSEPGCAVREAVQKGLLNEKRLDSYFRQKIELESLSGFKKT